MTERDTALTDDDVPHDPQLRKLYHDLPLSEPPRHLDAKILTAAREDITSQSPAAPFSRYWAWPFSLAALMVLSVSVVVLVQPQVGMDDAVLLPPMAIDLPAPGPNATGSRSSSAPEANKGEEQQAVPALHLLLEDVTSGKLRLNQRSAIAAPSPAPPAGQHRGLATPAVPTALAPAASRSLSPARPSSAPTISAPRTSKEKILKFGISASGVNTPASSGRAQGMTSTAPDTPKQVAPRPSSRGTTNSQLIDQPASDARERILRLWKQEKEQSRRARQDAERDAVRERLRASTRESKKHETASQRRDELKRLLEAAEQPKPSMRAKPPDQDIRVEPRMPAAKTAPPDDAVSRNPNTVTGAAPLAAPQLAPAVKSRKAILTPAPAARSFSNDATSQRDEPSASKSKSSVDPVTREFARIRALLNQRDTKLAAEVLDMLLKRYPGIPVPKDILARLK